MVSYVDKVDEAHRDRARGRVGALFEHLVSVLFFLYNNFVFSKFEKISIFLVQF